MRKLSIKDVIEFRGKTDNAKRNFAANIKLDKAKSNDEGGGDYWISCLSALSNFFSSNEAQPILDKKEELFEKYKATEIARTKTMYQRNIHILSNYEDFDLKKWKPTKKLKFIKKRRDQGILLLKGLEIKVFPHHIFTFERNGSEEIGAIWFIAKLGGLSEEELAMFSDAQYRYLKTYFAKQYNINSKFCIAVDVVNAFEVRYSELESGKISSILSSTIDDIKKLI